MEKCQFIKHRWNTNKNKMCCEFYSGLQWDGKNRKEMEWQNGKWIIYQNNVRKLHTKTEAEKNVNSADTFDWINNETNIYKSIKYYKLYPHLSLACEVREGEREENREKHQQKLFYLGDFIDDFWVVFLDRFGMTDINLNSFGLKCFPENSVQKLKRRNSQLIWKWFTFVSLESGRM